MEFRILGPLEVLEDGQALDVGGSKQQALLAVLLLNANRVVSSDRLIDALWDERPPETAPKALQVYVSQLRRTLGKERVLTRSSGYLLCVDSEELDLARFHALLEGAKSTVPPVAATKLREALGLWRGPPLPEFGSHGFAQPEIARLEELRMSCLEQRIDAELAQGHHAELVGELEWLVKEHPLREPLRAQLMLSLYRSGRQAEALDAYHVARRTLVGQLGIEPSKALRELEQAILRQDPSLDVSPADDVAFHVDGTSPGAFVGRESELESLRSGLAAAFAGQGRLFLLAGEPGIGKSRLAEEVVRQARARGARVLVGRCWEAGGAPAYWPWVQLLRTYIDESEPETLRGELDTRSAAIAQIVPEVAEFIPDAPQHSPDDDGARFRLFDSVARFLKVSAAARPLVVVLDDLHAADEPSLLLLRFVAGELAASRILVVGAYRDVDPTVRDPLASSLAELAREPVVSRIELGGLAKEHVGRYIELSTGRTPPGELVSTIHTETEGNPLFVGEVVRLLAPEGRLPDVDVPILWTLGVPQGVREVIGRRLRRLPDECVQVLTLASVLGREFRLDALKRLSELEADALFDRMHEATAARVLSSVPGAHGRLRFAHALIRETLYDGLTTPRRVQLHRRAGEALEALYAQYLEPHLAELAHHFFEAAAAGAADKALTYARRAGDRALALLAYEEAARLYGLALQALELEGPVDSAERCELLLVLGEALARGGNTPDAKQAFIAGADLARSEGLTAHLARAALGYGGRFPWLRAGSDSQLVPLLEEALAGLGEAEPMLRVKLLARLAGALRDQPTLEPRASLSRQAVEIARQLGDRDGLGYALASLFTAIWSPELEELTAIAEEVTRLAEETGEAERAVDACWLRRIVWLTRGEVERVESAAKEHRALASELKQPSQQWYDAVMRSTWALFRGDFAEAEQVAEEALRLGQRAQSWDAGYSYRLMLFFLRREQGRLHEIENLVRQTVDEYSGYRSFRCLVALLECELGRGDEARRAFEGVEANDFAALPRDSEWLFCVSVLAEVAGELQERDRAAVLYPLLLPYARLNAVAAGEIAVGSVARYLGVLASTMSNWDRAARHFEDALEMNERMGAQPWVAHTQVDYARMLLAHGDPRDAQRAGRLLELALATYTDLGMTAPLKRARALVDG